MAPLVVARKGFYTDLAKWAAAKAFGTLRVDGKFLPTRPWPRLERFREHTIELPVAEIDVEPQSEAALRQSEERMRHILETALDAVVSFDADGTITQWNPQAEQIFGWTSEEAIGRNVSILMPEPYRQEHDSYIQRYQATGERRIIGIGRIVVGERKDGSTFPMELAVGEAEVVAGGRFFTGFVRDLT